MITRDLGNSPRRLNHRTNRFRLEFRAELLPGHSIPSISPTRFYLWGLLVRKQSLTSSNWPTGVSCPSKSRAAPPLPAAWTNLIRFRDRFPDLNITGACLHTGTQTAVVGGWLHILPVTALWQH